VTAPLEYHLVPLCLRNNLSPPPTSSTPSLLPSTHPLCAALVIFCATFEKDSEKPLPVNPTSRYLYDCLLVAIALLYFSCKSYVVTVRHRKLCGIEYFKSVFLKYISMSHMVDFYWSGHICHLCLQSKFHINLYIIIILIMHHFAWADQREKQGYKSNVSPKRGIQLVKGMHIIAT